MKQARMEALREALKMEEDGKAFYKKAMEKANSKLAKEIFQSLISAEEKHVKRISELYRALEQTGQWPDAVLTRNHAETLPNIFAAAMANIQEKVPGTATDIDALKMAAKLEEQSSTRQKLLADSQLMISHANLGLNKTLRNNLNYRPD